MSLLGKHIDVETTAPAVQEKPTTAVQHAVNTDQAAKAQSKAASKEQPKKVTQEQPKKVAQDQPKKAVRKNAARKGMQIPDVKPKEKAKAVRSDKLKSLPNIDAGNGSASSKATSGQAAASSVEAMSSSQVVDYSAYDNYQNVAAYPYYDKPAFNQGYNDRSWYNQAAYGQAAYDQSYYDQAMYGQVAYDQSSYGYASYGSQAYDAWQQAAYYQHYAGYEVTPNPQDYPYDHTSGAWQAYSGSNPYAMSSSSDDIQRAAAKAIRGTSANADAQSAGIAPSPKSSAASAAEAAVAAVGSAVGSAVNKAVESTMSASSKALEPTFALAGATAVAGATAASSATVGSVTSSAPASTPADASDDYASKAINLEHLRDELKRSSQRSHFTNAWRNALFAIVAVAAAAVLVSMLFVPVLRIFGNSMNPTMNEGQTVLAVKTTSFEQGDVVAFYYNNKVLVKRVIAGPGSWVDINDDGVVTVDGKELDEPYVKELSLGESDITYPYQVPDNRYFVLGDNREVSIDSRSSTIGCVSPDQAVGRVVASIFPFDTFGLVS